MLSGGTARLKQRCRLEEDQLVSEPLNRAICLQVEANQSDLAGWI